MGKEQDKAPDPAAAGTEKDYRNEIAGAFGLMTELGVSMFACLFLGILAGKALDAWLGTPPTLLLAGALLGSFAAFKVLYDLAIKKWMR